MEALLKTPSLKRSLGLAVTVALLFGLLALLVWRNHLGHQEILAERHTQDVALQASQRLHAFMEFHLRVASVFAKRWSTHENADFSRRRFDEFAAVVVGELPGYAALGMIDQDARTVWSVPQSRTLEALTQTPEFAAALNEIARDKRVFLSTPFKSQKNETALYALLPLLRGQGFLGYLTVLFKSETLMRHCFQEGILSEFNFQVRDGGQFIFKSGQSFGPLDKGRHTNHADASFAILNRTWQLTAIPRTNDYISWGEKAAIPLLGLILSAGMGVLTFLLIRRVDMYKAARDKTLIEIAEREKAETDRNQATEQLALLSRKAMAAQEEERARLSIEMHDELGQILTALRLNIELVQKQLKDTYRVPANSLSNAIEMAEKATDELRRLCKGLRPPLLDDLGLAPAIQLLVTEFQAQSGIHVTLDLPKEDTKRYPSEVVSLCAYRILQESLTNVRRHSQAERVDISLGFTDDSLRLTVRDNGSGFDISEHCAPRGCGLVGMRERANLVNGNLDIHSSRGQGTTVAFSAPFPSS